MVTSKCNALFSIEQNTHKRLRSHTQKMVEYGGNLTFNMKTKTLSSGKTNSGKYNGIKLARGVVDWHSHPAKCKNDNTCALGLPSPADLYNILIGAMGGTSAHLVYAKEGTYVIQVSAPVLRVLKKDSGNELLRTALKRINTHFHALQKQFVNKLNFSYKRYIKQWIKDAREFGFNVQLFKQNTRPRIRVHFDCHLLERKVPFIAKIDSPV